MGRVNDYKPYHIGLYFKHTGGLFVVYGIDETYSMIAQDRNMNGAAITNHFPLLVGLEPETEYIYRLQGSGSYKYVYLSLIVR